jgi:hypothetical protein
MFSHHFFCMKVTRGYLLLVGLAAALMSVPTLVTAQCESRRRSMEEDFLGSNYILIAKVESKTDFGGYTKYVLKAEKIYKGKIAAGEKLVFRQHSHSPDEFDFSSRHTDVRYLLYLDRKVAGIWQHPPECSRSVDLKYAGVDIRYLEARKRLEIYPR